MSKSKIYRDITKEYDRDQARASAALAARKEEVYRRCPRIGEIDKLLAGVGIEITKAVISRKSDTESLIEELRKKSNELLEEKDVLLVENGFPIDFLFSVYKCHICRDTGYEEGRRCKCFRQRLITHAYSMSNLGGVTSYENFDMFDFRYYSDKPYQNEKLSPKEKMQQIYSIALNFVSDFDIAFTNLFFYGSSGLGKTFLCHSIAKELLDKGKTVIYITAFELFKMIERLRFNKEDIEGEPDEFLDMLLTVDLLIIDDLGTEFSTSLSSSELFNYLNQRLIGRRATVISTNLSPKDLINQYSDRIVSRLYGNYKILNFYGDDIRILKKRAGN